MGASIALYDFCAKRAPALGVEREGSATSPTATWKESFLEVWVLFLQLWVILGDSC